MGLPAAGVQAMKLSAGDVIVAADVARAGAQVLILTTHGYGLRTPVEKFPTQKRYGAGVMAMRLGTNHGAVADAVVVSAEQELFAIMHRGVMKVLRMEDFQAGNRAGRGRQIAGLKEGQVRKLLALVIPKVKGDETVSPTPPPPPPPPAKSASARKVSAKKGVSRAKASAPPKATTQKSSKPAAKRASKAAARPAASRPTERAPRKTASRAAARPTKRAPRKTASRAAAKPASRTRATASRSKRAPVQAPLLTPDAEAQVRKTSLIDAKPAAKATRSSKPAKKSSKTTRTPSTRAKAKPKPASKPAKSSTRSRSSKPKTTKAKPATSLDAIKKRVKKKK